MKFRKIIKYACVLAAGAVAFLLGRVSARWPRYVPPTTPYSPYALDPGPSLQDYEHEFADLVARWSNDVAVHEGHLPADPYRYLHENGIPIELYSFALHLPPRVNRDLSKNPRWPIFWKPYGRFSEVWTCYADGTWDRLPESEAGADWYTPLIEAGYPVRTWHTWKDKADWAQKNASRLRWDESRKLYVVGQAKAAAGRTTDP